MTRSPLYDPEDWSNQIYLESRQAAEEHQEYIVAIDFAGEVHNYASAITALLRYRK